jgi:hypothetical protein
MIDSIIFLLPPSLSGSKHQTERETRDYSNMTVTDLAATVTELAVDALVPSPPSLNGDAEEGPGRIPARPIVQRKMTSKKSSMLAVSDDPFAPREGKTLLWRNVNMTLVRVRLALLWYMYFLKSLLSM